jgi:hypothetical protein
MTTSQFYKAADKVKKVNLARIDLGELSTYTIRELRAVIAKLNKEAKGWLFCKATLGKAVSALRKEQLLNIIWSYLTHKRYAPKSFKWVDKALTPNSRITALLPTEHSTPWTVNLGFSTQKEAETLQNYLHQRGLCKYSVARPGKRTGYPVELKVWELDQGALRCLVEKEEHRLLLQRSA